MGPRSDNAHGARIAGASGGRITVHSADIGSRDALLKTDGDPVGEHWFAVRIVHNPGGSQVDRARSTLDRSVLIGLGHRRHSDGWHEARQS
jgi:hypothetical protein